MTPNDAQMDVLLRRFAGQSQGTPATEHLDADELNLFAEGTLPAAARSRYVSHLADCDDCRKIVSQLAMSSGAVLAQESPGAATAGYSWWKRLGGFFSPMILRYAAFAFILVTVAGVVFLVTRRPRESSLIAFNESEKQTQVEAVKPPDNNPPGSANNTGTVNPSPTIANPQQAAAPTSGKPDALKTADPAAPPPKPAEDVAGVISPAAPEKKAEEPVMSKSGPRYSPLPPVESQRAEPERGGTYSSNAGGPRKSESPSDKFKVMDRSRSGEMPKDVDDTRRTDVAAARKQSGNDEKERGRESDAVLSRDRNVTQARPRGPATQTANQSNQSNQSNQTGGAANQAQSVEPTPQTRSAGGRKFRRQGSSWIDTKFKSSMPVKTVSRGSSEFDALDSGLRSVAQQMGGEVLIVWKGKAYLIR